VILQWLFLSLLALSLGSFFNVLIYRIPNNESLWGRSRCQNCNKTINWYYNIPILSWVYLKGRCKNCSSKISIQYPLIELLTLIIFILVFYKNGFNLDSLTISLIFSLLIVLSMIDYYIQAVPDSINLLALTLGLFLGDFTSTLSSILMAAGGFTLLRFYVSFIIQKEAMGEGDIILAGTMGAILGVPNILIAIFLSSLLALPFAYIAHKRDLAIPFIPFLATATLITYILDLNLYQLLETIYG
jgi:leader peptidase (prepilin peptidase)/N-methyltransferase